MLATENSLERTLRKSASLKMEEAIPLMLVPALEVLGWEEPAIPEVDKGHSSRGYNMLVTRQIQLIEITEKNLRVMLYHA